MRQLVAREALDYLNHRVADVRVVTLREVKRTYDVHKAGDHLNALTARRRMMKLMFGTVKPEIRF